MRLAGLLLLTLLAAGCLGAAVEPASTQGDPTLVRPQVVAPRFLPPVKLGTLTNGAEPSIAVSPEGAVYVSTPRGFWRSDDEGRSYRTIGNATGCQGLPTCDARYPSELDENGDTTIVAGPDGAVYWAGLQLNSVRPTVPFRKSADGGETWSAPFDVASRNWSDRQWLSLDDDGSLYAAWRDSGNANDTRCLPLPAFCFREPFSPEPPSGVMVRGSHDGGVTWPNATRLMPEGLSGPVATDPSSTWIYLPTAFDGVSVSRSADKGTTWETVSVHPDVPGYGTFIFPVAAVDDAGTIYVVWSQGRTYINDGDFMTDRAHHQQDVYLSRSSDHGASWSKPLVISPGVPSVLPWIAAGAQGRIVVAWYEATAPIPSDRAPNVWNVIALVSTTADQEEPTFERGQVNQKPHHVGAICTSGVACVAGGDRSLLDFFQVQLLPDGSPVIAYTADNDVHMAMIDVYASRMIAGTPLR